MGMSIASTCTPTEIMITYLDEVGAKMRYHLIDEIAHEDMVDEANQAFGGRRAVPVWWRMSKAFTRTSPTETPKFTKLSATKTR